MSTASEEPPIIESPLSQRLTRNGVTIQIEIYADREGKWILEVVDSGNNSHVWDEHFESDREALVEAIRAVDEEPREFLPEAGISRDAH